MTFEVDGFLAEDLSGWASQVREKFKSWFELVSDLNRMAMRILYKATPMQSSSQQLVGALIFARSLQSYQAATLLAERGLLSDARTLVRSCAESAIALGGIAHDESFIDEIIDDYHKHRLSIANVMAIDPECSKGLTPQQLDGLEKISAEISAKYQSSKPKSVKWDVVATRVGMTTLYNTVYRGISGDAAHVTADALNRHIQANDQADIECLIFEPSSKDLEDTFSAAVPPRHAQVHLIESRIKRLGARQTVRRLNHQFADDAAIPVPLHPNDIYLLAIGQT